MMIQWIGLSKDGVEPQWVKDIAKKNGVTFQWQQNPKFLTSALATVQSKPTIVLLQSSPQWDVYELCKEISLTHRIISIILLLPQGEIDYKKAMLSGAINVLDEDLAVDLLYDALEKAKDQLRTKAEKAYGMDLHQGRVLTICSTKGGVGKTTMAVNLAVSFAMQKEKVVVVDLDLQFGDLPIVFDVQPRRTIYEWIKETGEGSQPSIEEYLTKHESGVDILAAPLLPEFAELIKGEHVKHLVEELKHEYDRVLIDTPPALLETTLVALENSDDIVMITSNDLATIKNGKLCLDTLELLKLKGNLKVVLNRDHSKGEIKPETVETILGKRVFARIPNDYKTVISSINQGTPFVLLKSKSKVAKKVIQLAERLQSENQQSKRKFKNSFFSKFILRFRKT